MLRDYCEQHCEAKKDVGMGLGVHAPEGYDTLELICRLVLVDV